jgi:DNA-binding IclR family transcriptional regulator
MQSADKALRILSLFDEGHPERGVTELSRLIGTHKSTASRMLTAMEMRGFVTRVGDRYRLGPELVRLGTLAVRQLGLAEACRPAMTSLARDTGETVNLAVADGDGALNIDQIAGAHLVGVTDWTGRRLPLEHTANGKVLLAFGAAAVVKPSPVLHEQITQTQRAGYAIAIEDLEPGLVAVAAPVLDAGGTCVAAISVSGPLYRIGQARLPELGSRCVEAARAASRSLGHRQTAA